MLLSLSLSFLTAVLLILSFPGWNRGQLAWLALVPLLQALSTTPHKKRAFALGFLAMAAAWLGSLYWVYPTCRAGGVNVFFSLLAVASLAAYCALYGGLFSVVAHMGRRAPAAARPFILAAVWALLETVRVHLLGGFPWLLLGYSQWNVPQHLPLSAVGGPYIVSFMLVLFNGMLSEILSALRARRWRGTAAALPALGALVLMVAASVTLSKRARATPPDGAELSVALVQGNIDQYKKWDRAYEEEIMAVYDRLTWEAAAEPVDLIIWPETAVPGWYPNDPRFAAWVADVARRVRKPLLLGAVTRDGGDYNAAFLVSPEGEILSRYRKRHLVPFGETIPLRAVLGKLVPVLGTLGDFDASDDWTVFKTSSAAFGVNVCFESLFPSLVKGFVSRGAGFTVNLTNDGWFLDTAAAEQHFAAAPFRAVENRVWTLCITNTGVTAIVDPSGRVAARLPRAQAGVLRGRITAKRGVDAPGAGG